MEEGESVSFPPYKKAVVNRAAFTLIELVVSALLASIMLVVLLNMTWSTMRETRELDRNDLDRAAVAQMVDILVSDLSNARGLAASPNRLALYGFLGNESSSASSRVASLIPGGVTYEIVSIGDRPTLVRHSSTGSSSTATLMWKGFGAFRIDVLQSDDDSSNDESPGEDGGSVQVNETGGLPGVPPIFRIELSSDKGRVLHSEVIHHHAI